MLALRFQQDGWSMKRLHREIVLSRRIANLLRSSGEEKPAEGCRRSFVMEVSGAKTGCRRDTRYDATHEWVELRSKRPPGFSLFDQRGGLNGFRPVETFPPDGMKRTIYAHKVRRERDAIFGAFDCPDAGESTAKRRSRRRPSRHSIFSTALSH